MSLACQIMRAFTLIISLPLLLPLANAQVMLNPSADTFIAYDGDGVFENYSAWSESQLQLANIFIPGSPDFYYTRYSLFHWDVSAYSGESIAGEVTLSLYVSGITSTGVSRTFSVFQLPEAFDLNTTFNNYNSSAPILERLGNDLVKQVTFPGLPQGYFSFTLPGAVVQSWIDNPSSNFGIGLGYTADPVDRELRFDSTEAFNREPVLTFNVVPEPAITTLALMGLGIFFLSRRRARA